MLYNKHNLVVAKFASHTEIKPELASVLFTDTHTVAGDSARLLEVTVPPNANMEDYPTTVSKNKFIDKLTEPLMIPARTIKAFKQVKPSKRLPIINNVALFNTGNSIEIVSTNLEDINKAEARPTQGNFPQYEQVFLQPDDIAREIVINGELLGELLTELGKFADMGHVTLKIPKKAGKPIQMEAKGGDSQSARALLMPIKS